MIEERGMKKEGMKKRAFGIRGLVTISRPVYASPSEQENVKIIVLLEVCHQKFPIRMTSNACQLHQTALFGQGTKRLSYNCLITIKLLL